MKRWLTVLAILAALLPSTAGAVFLYGDTAPNVYGSPLWDPWWADAKADVIDGTFTNMRSATNPGALNALDPYDEIVYSTGDLGKRLHWIYWLPGQTLSGLDGLFEVKWVIDWGGDDWTYEGGSWAADGAEVGWSQPASWEEDSGGVIGSLGFAWWSTDDDAPPFSTNTNPYDETDQADIDALRAQVLDYQTFARGMVRYRPTVNDAWDTTEMQMNMIPEPGSVALLGVGLLGLVVRRRWRR